MLHNDSRSLVALPWFSSGIKVIHQTETNLKYRFQSITFL